MDPHTHGGGPGRRPLELLPRLKAPGPEWALAGAVLLGTALLHVAVPKPEAPSTSSTALAVSLANQLKTGASSAGSTSTDGSVWQ